MCEKYHLADGEKEQKQKTQIHPHSRQNQIYPQTQKVQEYCLANIDSNNIQSLSSTSTTNQRDIMSSSSFDPSSFNSYYYENSQWLISQQQQQLTTYSPHEYYPRQPPTTFSQPIQKKYNIITPRQPTHSVNASINNTYYSPLTSEHTPSVPNYLNNYIQPYIKQEEVTNTSLTSKQISTTVYSPAKTPILSPVISNTWKRRVSTAPAPSISEAANLKREEEESEDKLTVSRLEKELSFLKDDCDTIVIMLDSLRNAFLAGDPQASDKPRRSKTVSQNTEMQREMRIAYDDLMLQVRQLEKKIEKLEKKSRDLADDSKSDDGDEANKKKNKKRKTNA